jgi:hypothetical protein
MAEVVADDIVNDDRRRVVNGGIQRGREAVIANMRAVAEVGVKNIEYSVIAIRGDHLALGRTRVSGGGQWPDAYGVEVLNLVEVAADNRFTTGIAFDIDDIDAAFGELDARYIAGEAAAYAHPWSVIAESFAAVNRRAFPALTPDFKNIDHRRAVAFASGEMTAYIHAALDSTGDIRIYIEAVHRLSSLGALVTGVAHNAVQQGFEAE